MKKLSFNDNWIFYSVRTPDNRISVTLPHDAMQTEKRIPGLKNGEQSGYYPGGKYVYEKTFEADEDMVSKTVLLEFEGIYMKSSVFLNDELVGGHVYGYTDFFVNLTGKIQKGENRLKVIADNSQVPNSRWYSGSGIYRDVNMLVAGESYIRPLGVKILTKSISPAVVSVDIDTVCGEDCEVETRFLFEGETIAVGKGNKCEVTIENPKLWTADTPELYQVKVSLKKENVILDEAETRFGIRTLAWSHEKGLQINGETVKLRGGCVHHEHGYIGAESFYNAEFRRAHKMKEAGFNAVRYAHNPAARTFLDACDEVGLYVMDESFDMWTMKKSDRDYGLYFEEEWEKDLTAAIRVAYNHPSVIMYSIGNEILDIGTPNGAGTTKLLTDKCHELDDSRPVINCFSPSLTCLAGIGIGMNTAETTRNDEVDPYELGSEAENSGSKLANALMNGDVQFDMAKAFSPEAMDRLAGDSLNIVDIDGYNYGLGNYETHLKNHPDSVLCGSETFIAQLADHWSFVMSHDCMIGEFLWAAWDYLGEAGIGLPRYPGMSQSLAYPYPGVCGNCSCFDLSGDLDAQGAFVSAVWNSLKKPYLAVRPLNHSGQEVKMNDWRKTNAFASWDWKGFEGTEAQIQVFANSNYGEAEVWLNDKTLGRRKLVKNMAEFSAPYEEGELKAICYEASGKASEPVSLKSPGRKKQLCLTAETDTVKADTRDVVYIDIAVTDEEGIVRTLEEEQISVWVEGPGELIGYGCADPLTEEEYTCSSRKTYRGRALAIVRAAGEEGTVRITAETEDGSLKAFTEIQAI